MQFDWLQFCQTNRISYVSKSSNVARNHIAIRCPWCGGNDPSAHMGLNLDVRNPVWGCLRDARHRGRNPTFLVMRLLGCSIVRAKEIVGFDAKPFSDDLKTELEKFSDEPNAGFRHNRGWLGQWSRSSAAEQPPQAVKLSKEIKPIDGKGYSPRFLDYLRGRGFPEPWLPVELAQLHYAVTGPFAYRLIFPVFFRGELVSLTGRDITGKAPIRYRSLTSDDNAVNIKHCLYFFDRFVQGGEVLFLVEGPFDALKMNCFLRPDCAAVAFFGMPTDLQMSLLRCYLGLWRSVVVLLDADAQMQRLALHYAVSLPQVRVQHVRLPQSDPGALTAAQIRAINRSTQK